MARERTGFVVKRKNERTGKIELFARVQYTDGAGKRREKMRRAENQTDANRIIKGL